MERDWLDAQLQAGRSIESIAGEVAKHPLTVGYHVKKHGLRSPHASKHAARGGIARDVLEPLVTEGRSVRAIALHLGVSYATVQHGSGRYGLTTRRAARLKESAGAREAGLKAVDLMCDRHGPTSFVSKSDGGFRCLRCRSEDVVKRRRRVKELLVEEAGGCCALCGYSPLSCCAAVPSPGPREQGLHDRAPRCHEVARSGPSGSRQMPAALRELPRGSGGGNRYTRPRSCPGGASFARQSGVAQSGVAQSGRAFGC